MTTILRQILTITILLPFLTSYSDPKPKIESLLQVTNATFGCEVWGGDGEGASLVREIDISITIANQSVTEISIENAGWSMAKDSLSIDGIFPKTPSIPAGMSRTLHTRRHLSPMELAWLDEGVECSSNRTPLTLLIQLRWRSAGSPDVAEFPVTVRWLSCFEPRLSPESLASDECKIPTPMPDVPYLPTNLIEYAESCRNGESAACMRVGDYYFSNVSGQRGRTFYHRGADLAWAAIEPKPTVPERCVSDEKAAISALRSAWPDMVSGISDSTQTQMLMNATIGKGHGQIGARLVSYCEAFRWVYQLEYEHQGALNSAVLSGSSNNLRRNGSCWAIMLYGGMDGEILAYVASDNGNVLVVTRVPEG